MQYFGEIQTKYDEIFLTSSFLYFNNDEEDIKDANEIKKMTNSAKNRKKNIIGTIYLYNPVVTPTGFDSNKPLLEQDFEDFDKLIELKAETYITPFKQAMSKQCKGKIVEIKNLFNLIEKHIDASQLLMKFNDDLEKYNSAQNTEFDRDIMYQDAQNTIPNGKFVFFSWGDKINMKEFPHIKEYAKTIYENSEKLGKKIAFIYKKEKSKDGSIEYLQFSHTYANMKHKNAIANAIKKSFETFPPTCQFYE